MYTYVCPIFLLRLDWGEGLGSKTPEVRRPLAHFLSGLLRLSRDLCTELTVSIGHSGVFVRVFPLLVEAAGTSSAACWFPSVLHVFTGDACCLELSWPCYQVAWLGDVPHETMDSR